MGRDIENVPRPLLLAGPGNRTHAAPASHTSPHPYWRPHSSTPTHPLTHANCPTTLTITSFDLLFLSLSYNSVRYSVSHVTHSSTHSLHQPVIQQALPHASCLAYGHIILSLPRYTAARHMEGRETYAAHNSQGRYGGGPVKAARGNLTQGGRSAGRKEPHKGVTKTNGK